MELTLTGATLNDLPPSTATRHSHDHSHNHRHDHSNSCRTSSCCSQSKPMDASALLPTQEQVQRFRSDKLFRLGVLSNVVRGGSFEIFINLIKILTSRGGLEADDENGVLELEDPVGFASLVNGYGVDGHTLGHWCAKRGDDPRFLKFLISKSLSPNGAQILIDLHLPSKDSVGMYPLHWAVTEGAIPLVSMLLHHLQYRPSPLMKIDDLSPNSTHTNEGIDAQDTSGCTPLLIASQYGHPDLAAFLIQRGADPNTVDSSRDTALHWAAYKGSVEVCGMLLHLQGVEGQLDTVDAFGQTPLHLASLRGNVETVMFLMEEASSGGVRGGTVVKGSTVIGRVGSKLTAVSGRSATSFPAKLLVMRDKEGKTPLDLAAKKKKLGCELLLQQYHEQYLAPKRSFISRLGQTIRDLCSIRNWKAWMGMGANDLPVGQNPTFPFYWMTSHLLLSAIIYCSEFVGVGVRKRYGDEGLLWDRLGLHFSFMISWFLSLVTLYYTYTTNPGILDAREVGSSSKTTSSCQVLCFNGGGYSKDKISLEMVSATRELRRQYDAVIESFSNDFPSEDKRIPLCHTCRIVKPLRSKHCRVARRCVLLFDHHCPFVGTTVGLYNYIHFYLFLFFFLMAEICFSSALVMFLIRSKTFPVGIGLVGGYISLYTIPIVMMVVYHTQLVLNNMTTNEQLNLRKYRYFWEGGRFRNPFDQGKIRNVFQRLSPDESCYSLRTSEPLEETQAMLTNVV